VPPEIDLRLLALGAVWLVLAVSVYGNLMSRLQVQGGKVRTAEFGLPDLLVSLVLVSTFILLMLRIAWSRHSSRDVPTPASPEQILPSAAFFVILFVGIVGFLRWRGVRVSRVLGLDRMAWPKALVSAAGLIIAAFPLVVASGVLVKNFVHDPGPEQELVTLFREVTRRADYKSIIKIFAAGVLIAPLAEEFLFRGYFYGVFKRYFGSVLSGVFTAALFAAFHMNLASLASLFVLALCFTLAYEASGSLVVPMSMHALFNTAQLLFIYWQAQTPVS
jgi:membrane protease YdiL (CAAX protease family)